MVEPLWIDALQVKPVRMGTGTPPGLYLSADLGFKRLWVVGEKPGTVVYLEHEFRQGRLDGSTGLYVGEVALAVDPSGFDDQSGLGRGMPGQLVFEQGTISLICRGDHTGFIGPRIHVADQVGDPTYPYPIFCSRWALLMEDIDGENRVVFDTSAGTQAS
jgi:hypothetical protein